MDMCSENIKKYENEENKEIFLFISYLFCWSVSMKGAAETEVEKEEDLKMKNKVTP